MLNLLSVDSRQKVRSELLAVQCDDPMARLNAVRQMSRAALDGNPKLAVATFKCMPELKAMVRVIGGEVCVKDVPPFEEFATRVHNEAFGL